MSGSEIVQEIEKRTDGCWKPSPGSIYPLLAWLQERGFVKEALDREVGIKRYTLTKQGKELFEEHLKRSQEFPRRFQIFPPPMWFRFFPEKAQDLREATRGLALAILDLRDRLQQEYSEEGVNDAKEALEEATRKIERIIKKWEEARA